MRLALVRVGVRHPVPPGFPDTWDVTDAASVDRALSEAVVPDIRLVIDADLAGLSLVLTRLMRAGQLDTVETAVLLQSPVPYLARLGLPASRSAQLAVAMSGRPRLVGVIKDDSGGLCVDSAAVTPWTSPAVSPDRAIPSGPGQDGIARSGKFWVRAVVDDQRLCDGDVRSVSVRRLGPDELEATATLGRFRTRTCRGRSLQLACDEAQVVADGVGRERPRSKRTFFSEPKLWRLAL